MRWEDIGRNESRVQQESPVEQEKVEENRSGTGCNNMSVNIGWKTA